MNLKEVSNLFEQKGNEYLNKISFLEKNIITYEHVIEDLNKKFISKRAKKILYENYRIEITKDNIPILIETIKNDLYITKENLEKLRGRYKLCVFVKNTLRYRQIVLPFLIDFINEELRKDDIAEVELIKINELIKIHNVNIKSNQYNTILGKDLHLILNMLNHGYEEIEIFENTRSTKLDLIVNKFREVVDNNSLAVIIANFDYEKIYENIYEPVDFRYIYTEILRYIQLKIWELIEMVKNEEFYFDIETLKIIKDEYKDYLDKYLYFRNKVDEIDLEIENSLEEEIDEEISADEENETELENEIVNNLYYSSSSPEPNKCYFMKDLVTIREESLGKIEELLKRFKQGKKLNIKHLSGGKEKGFIEIKHDQIRIILKLINNNNYSVMGVFIKKSDNLIETYHNMYERPLAEINDDYAFKVEEEMQKYVAENKRSGTR